MGQIKKAKCIEKGVNFNFFELKWQHLNLHKKYNSLVFFMLKKNRKKYLLVIRNALCKQK